MPRIILLQFLLIADLELAVPDSRYRHEYNDNKLSVPKPNYCYMKQFTSNLSKGNEDELELELDLDLGRD